MTLHMNTTQPFAQLAKRLELPPTATREDIAGALLDATAKMRSDLDKATRKAVGVKTLMVAYESNTQEPRELARVLDTLSGVQTFQEVAHALVAAVAGLRNYRKALAASSFDKRETVLADMDLALALLSREGLLAVSSASSASSSSASTSTTTTAPTAAPRPTANHANLSRATVEEARRRGVDPDRVADTLRVMLGKGGAS